MNLTLVVDGSFCQKSRVGGIAVNISSDTGIKQIFSSARTQCTSSTEVESWAANAGIQRAFDLARDHDVTLSSITLHTDSQSTLAALSKLNHLGDKDCAFEVHHLPGHAGSTSYLSLRGETCDREAKSAMRRVRDLISP